VTKRGTGFGKMESKTAWESRNSRDPKYEEQEAVEEARTADIRGERREAAGAGAAAEAVRRTINCSCSAVRSERQSGS
jgi:hypothetical protein